MNSGSVTAIYGQQRLVVYRRNTFVKAVRALVRLVIDLDVVECSPRRVTAMWHQVRDSDRGVFALRLARRMPYSQYNAARALVVGWYTDSAKHKSARLTLASAITETVDMPQDWYDPYWFVHREDCEKAEGRAEEMNYALLQPRGLLAGDGLSPRVYDEDCAICFGQSRTVLWYIDQGMPGPHLLSGSRRDWQQRNLSTAALLHEAKAEVLRLEAKIAREGQQHDVAATLEMEADAHAALV